MKRTKIRYIFAAALFFCSFLPQHGTSSRLFSSKEHAACMNGDCSDSVKDCKAPRDFNSESLGCSCFDCEKGTPKQHLICTRDPAEAKTLFALIDKDKGP